MKTVQVKIADYAIIKEHGILITYGLGSCVGIALYDPGRKVAGLAHILLNDSTRFCKGVNNFNPAKFADTAIPLLLKGMIAQGASKADITAKIAGGASLFSRRATGSIGEKNITAVRFTLQKMGIPLQSAEVGGNYGRTMKLLADNGAVIITTAGKGVKIL